VCAAPRCACRVSGTPDRRLGDQCPDGIFTLDQALAAGFTMSAVRSRLSRGVWRELTHGVYASTTTPLGSLAWERSAMHSYAGRAVLSHVSAARAWTIPVPGDDSRAWMSIEARSRWVLPDNVRPVRTRHMPVAWQRGGLPVTPPARTVVDLAMCFGRDVLRDAIADVLLRRICTLGHVQTDVNRLTRRKGHAVLRATVAEFRPEFESVLEELVSSGFRRRAVPGFEPQYVVRDRLGCSLARVDFADAALKLAVEADGWAHHGSRAQQRRDKRRDRRLVQEGWLVLRFTADEILGNLDAVIDEIQAVRSTRVPAA
jgi:Protein of unknown function (DUF559)